MKHSIIACPGLNQHGPIMQFKGPELEMGKHVFWRHWVRWRPRLALPTKFLRVADCDGQPAVFFEGGGQGHVATAAQRRKLRRTAAAPGAVKHGTVAAFAKTAEPPLPPAPP